jgi:hypothetical protein
VFSSGVATLVFAWRGILDLKLGIILGISMFLGALIGGRVAILLSAIWLQRIFIAAVLALRPKCFSSTRETENQKATSSWSRLFGLHQSMDVLPAGLGIPQNAIVY